MIGLVDFAEDEDPESGKSKEKPEDKPQKVGDKQVPEICEVRIPDAEPKDIAKNVLLRYANG